MNQTNVNDISIIKTYLERLYLEYATQMGRFETASVAYFLISKKYKLFDIFFHRLFVHLFSVELSTTRL